MVVTFNRKKLLLECLKALRTQTRPPDAIFIIDGPSTDGTPEALRDQGYIKKIPPHESKSHSWTTGHIIVSDSGKPIRVIYVRLYEDVGGAGGFHEGIKRAYSEGYDWIWVMDDDAEPKKDALEQLLNYVDLPNAVVVTPLKLNVNGKFVGHRGTFVDGNFLKFRVALWSQAQKYISIHHSSFVGPLIKKDAIDSIGFPLREFFIWYDDVEYFLRLIKIGAVYMIPSSVIVHKEETKISEVKQIGPLKRRVIPYGKFWKLYFEYRNWAYLGYRYAPRIQFFKKLITNYLLIIGGILLFDDHKLSRIFFVTSAYLDGLRGIFDNDKPKRILYGGNKNG
ncbi:glycosyltransferase family 2 protein [Archaeoglobus neptunius]|uniref:glycosyltransferase family 2 protein n=1 Tax=Archaeoglobus neptunius TaxID=2798580 RepID=UPI0019255180